MDNRADIRPPESRWEEMGRVMAEAEVIEKLTDLFAEKAGRTRAEARRMAIERFEADRSAGR